MLIECPQCGSYEGTRGVDVAMENNCKDADFFHAHIFWNLLTYLEKKRNPIFDSFHILSGWKRETGGWLLSIVWIMKTLLLISGHNSFWGPKRNWGYQCVRSKCNILFFHSFCCPVLYNLHKCFNTWRKNEKFWRGYYIRFSVWWDHTQWAAPGGAYVCY